MGAPSFRAFCGRVGKHEPKATHVIRCEAKDLLLFSQSINDAEMRK
jgi:hypothetical protein